MGLIVLEGLMEEKNKQLEMDGFWFVNGIEFRVAGAEDNESEDNNRSCWEDEGTLRKLVTEIQKVEEEDESYMDGESEDQT
ncbi:hypothetical protein C5167_044557 [Papaver somniferum]|uniref:Uncharacterized protein n=1 Tax=Papaver somniferum TaxID=3469 RepID=A0A4Y7LBC4_PAPSO|nr:hypothetical protein C5167_044557 [Papaver somniferum]